MDRTSNDTKRNCAEADEYLSHRGVLLETAKEHQVEIAHFPEPERIHRWLGRNGVNLDAAIAFPNLARDDDGSIYPSGYSVRCFPPQTRGDGTTAKFLATADVEYRPYILPAAWKVASDTSAPIYIVEKQTAALLFYQAGLNVIALDGTWGAAAKRVNGKPVVLHSVLTKFDWIGRPTYLCFDLDFRSRQNVLQGLIRTYILFSIVGARVRVIQWDQAYKGIDDYIAEKAGLFVEKQREELDALTAEVSSLSPKEAAGTWLMPESRLLFENEVGAIQPGTAQRSLLAECVHNALGTTASDLKKTWGVRAKEGQEDEENDVLLKYFNSIKPWPAPVSLSDILWEIHDLTEKYVFSQQFYRIITSLWVPMTYVFTEAPFLPLLVFTSPAQECGKTAHMTALVWLVYRPVSSALVSSAGAHRYLDFYKGFLDFHSQ